MPRKLGKGARGLPKRKTGSKRKAGVGVLGKAKNPAHPMGPPDADGNQLHFAPLKSNLAKPRASRLGK
jgi:hypothetical protein